MACGLKAVSLLRLILTFGVLGGRLWTRRPLDHLAQLVDVHGNARQERHADLNRHVGGIFPVLIAKAARFDHFSSKRSQRRACDVIVEGGVKTAIAIDGWASAFSENVIRGGLLIFFRWLWRVWRCGLRPLLCCWRRGGNWSGLLRYRRRRRQERYDRQDQWFSLYQNALQLT
jgi:hypothetical protein